MIIGCYARLSLQADVKNVSMFLKYSFFFVPPGSKYFLLHITSLTGRWSPEKFFFLPICCP